MDVTLIVATIVAIRKEQADDLLTLQKEEVLLRELEKNAAVQTESLKSLEQLTLKAKEDMKAAAPLLQKIRSLDQKLEEQFASGRLLACISSRPGQCGRADGYILEGKELEFYQRKLATKKQHKK